MTLHDDSAIGQLNFGYPILDISQLNHTMISEDLLSRKLIEKHRCLPLSRWGNKVLIATSDPDNFSALEDFQFNLALHAEPILVEQAALEQVIERIMAADMDQLEITDEDEQRLAGIEATAEQQNQTDDEAKADDAPIVTFINKLMIDAIHRGASDLHFEPYEETYRVRFRIDGILQTINNPPSSLGTRIAARIKVMSRLDLAERRLPQDGRIKLRVGKQKMVDFRVSTLPTLYGEKVVMRILDSSAAMLNIDHLGYSAEQKKHFEQHLDNAQGMILVTGPTGSGKTVSLYTGLSILNTEARNISTAEDPVEINLPGINQVQINTRTGLTFASALRSFLRQDPDVVMVGEIRDLETAEIAMKASQTGHLVLSTLHTNSAAETLTRLNNMGVAAYNIASSVNLIIAQRLGRRLCAKCREVETIPTEELLREGFTEEQLAQPFTLYKAIGCSACSQGYKGRTGIYETLVVSPAISNLIMQNGSAIELQKMAQAENMHTLRQSGLEKVLQGITSLTELNRITRV